MTPLGDEALPFRRHLERVDCLGPPRRGANVEDGEARLECEARALSTARHGQKSATVRLITARHDVRQASAALGQNPIAESKKADIHRTNLRLP